VFEAAGDDMIRSAVEADHDGLGAKEVLAGAICSVPRGGYVHDLEILAGLPCGQGFMRSAVIRAVCRDYM
jgi:hypothetical protein